MLAAPAQTSLAVLEMAQAGRFDRESATCSQRRCARWLPQKRCRPPGRPQSTGSAPVTSVGARQSELAPGVVVVKVLVTCERGALTLIVSVTSAGQLTGLQLAPPDAIEPLAPWAAAGIRRPRDLRRAGDHARLCAF